MTKIFPSLEGLISIEFNLNIPVIYMTYALFSYVMTYRG